MRDDVFVSSSSPGGGSGGEVAASDYVVFVLVNAFGYSVYT